MDFEGGAAAAHVRAYGFTCALCAALPMTTPARIDRRGFSKTVASCGVSCEVCVASGRAEERKRSRARPWATDGGPGLEDAQQPARSWRPRPARGERPGHRAETGDAETRPESADCGLVPWSDAHRMHIQQREHNNLQRVYRAARSVIN